MTENPDPFRERAHRLVEAFADGEETSVVALLADASEPGASWRAADALAGASAARRRTLLVNLAGAGSGLDGFLEVEGLEGLEAVRRGERKLSEAAVNPPGRDFLYLPAGDPGPGDRPRPTEDEDVLRALRRLADKIREARGLLLLYLEAGALPQGLAGNLVDGAVPLVGADPHLPDAVPVLGRLDAPEEAEAPEEDETSADEDDFLPGVTGDEAAVFGAGSGPGGPSEEPGPPEGTEAPEGPGEGESAGPPPVESGDDLEDALVRPEPPADDPGEEPGPGPAGDEEDAEDVPEPAGIGAGASTDGPDGEGAEADAGDEVDPGEEDSGWRRHRRSAGFPWAKIAAGTAAVLLLAGGWWWFAGRAADAGAGAATESGDAVAAADRAGGDAPAEDGAAASDTAAGDSAGAAGSEGDAPPADAAASSPELTHSVLVASYSSWPDARDRAEALRSERGGAWLVAPTPVRGTVYWRLYAGALTGAEAGRALMEELVGAGVKDEARDWDIRPASLAWRLGVETARSAAEERVGDLRDRGIPAYVLPAAAGADTAWQVYAGAYESREAASRLGEMLEEAGVEGELVARRGEGDGR